MAQDQPVAALVVTLTDDLAPAIYSINRLCPESLCFVLPESAKPLVETEVQPRINQMPRRWDWVLLSDIDHFPSCYQTIARSLPGMLRNWGVEPGSMIVDVTGATAAMACAGNTAGRCHRTASPRSRNGSRRRANDARDAGHGG